MIIIIPAGFDGTTYERIYYNVRTNTASKKCTYNTTRMILYFAGASSCIIYNLCARVFHTHIVLHRSL